MSASICIDVRIDPSREVGAYAYWISWEARKISFCAPMRQVRKASDVGIYALHRSLLALQNSSLGGLSKVTVYSKLIWEKTSVIERRNCTTIIQELKIARRVGYFEFNTLQVGKEVDGLNQARITWCVRMSGEMLEKL